MNSEINDDLDAIMQKAKIAQEKYRTYSQEQVDKIFYHAALAINKKRVVLAKEAVAESNIGLVEDKVIKNHFACEFIYNQYREAKTCGILFHDEAQGIYKIAEPLGIIAGIVPTTNPTSTIIFKALLALKTRNGVVFSPHPRSKKCSIHTAQIIRDAAVEAGAPENIISWLANPTIELTQKLMQHPYTSIILATGGPGMVKSAYSSGTPAIGVGSGNVPAIIDKSANIEMAISSIIISKTFDNGTICASEQSVIVHCEIYNAVVQEFKKRGAYFLNKEEIVKIRKFILQNGRLNPDIVGQSALKIAKMAGIQVPSDIKLLIGEVEKIGIEEPLSYEKLSPILSMYKANDFADAVKKAEEVVAFGGMGHTSCLYINENQKKEVEEFGLKMKTGRILINSPGAQGAIGGIYNFNLEPSLTLGCGSWGKNSVGENITIKHLMNIKTLAERRENMLGFQVPPKIYFKFGSVREAFKDLKQYKRAFIITDNTVNKMYGSKITDILDEYKIQNTVFSQVHPDPDLDDIKNGLKAINNFQPDLIIALGGGSSLDAAKIISLLYEHSNIDFEDLAMRFMNIRKRIFKFSSLEKKASLIAIPTTSGTGSEVTPFAVITDSKKNLKYPITDYELTPDMAIIDPDFVKSMPKSLTAASGIDAITHGIEAYVAITASEYTDGLVLESLSLLFKYLPIAYKEGEKNLEAREKVHYAATMAGMAFANAFLGICHAMAHQLGGIFHLPHGIANALLLPHIIRYNAVDNPTKQSIFSQYTYPIAKQKYAHLSDFLNLGGSTEDEKIEKLIEKIRKLMKELDIPSNIIEAGVSEKDLKDNLEELTDRAFEDQCSLTNPRYPLFDEIRELYLKLLPEPK
ncbi:MAG: bifunctional acetaldehyde-CoA/alcohol dehydrogenase [Chlamydiae bacterium]|nr:bifunctional acetaldehyde-CoA/alcohol dehydrogenase [Chlamydiota bacterium]